MNTTFIQSSDISFCRPQFWSLLKQCIKLLWRSLQDHYQPVRHWECFLNKIKSVSRADHPSAYLAKMASKPFWTDQSEKRARHVEVRERHLCWGNVRRKTCLFGNRMPARGLNYILKNNNNIHTIFKFGFPAKVWCIENLADIFTHRHINERHSFKFSVGLQWMFVSYARLMWRIAKLL